LDVLNFDEQSARIRLILSSLNTVEKMAFHIYSEVPPPGGTRTAEHAETTAVVKAAFLNNLCAVN
jgi:hypothetical protein